MHMLYLKVVTYTNYKLYKKYKLYNCADDFKYCTCAKRETFKQLAGEQCEVICGAWASKRTYITVIYYNQSFVGLWTHSVVWKCPVHVEESVLLHGLSYSLNHERYFFQATP